MSYEKNENLIFDNYNHDLRMNLNKELAHRLSRSLFWDVDPETIDSVKHVLFIIERVLTRGTWEEFQIIITYLWKGIRWLIIHSNQAFR